MQRKKFMANAMAKAADGVKEAIKTKAEKNFNGIVAAHDEARQKKKVKSGKTHSQSLPDAPKLEERTGSGSSIQTPTISNKKGISKAAKLLGIVETPGPVKVPEAINSSKWGGLLRKATSTSMIPIPEQLPTSNSLSAINSLAGVEVEENDEGDSIRNLQARMHVNSENDGDSIRELQTKMSKMEVLLLKLVARSDIENRRGEISNIAHDV